MDQLLEMQNKMLEANSEVVAALRTLPEPTSSKDWPDYKEIPPDEKTLNGLTEIVKYEWENGMIGEDYWLPVHSWRILSRAKHEGALPHLIDCLIHSDEDDDWAKEELPSAIANFGRNAIPLLKTALLENPIFKEEIYSYMGIVEALQKIAEDHPSERERVVEIFRTKLRELELNPTTLNAILASSLAELGATSGVPEIIDAFAKDFVDLTFVDWEYIRKKLKSAALPKILEAERPSPTDIRYGGDDRMQVLLRTVGCAHNIDDLRCLLLGSVLAIELVPPSRLMGEILVDWDGEPVEFETDGQAAYVTREIIALWNELCAFQSKPFPLPALSCCHEQDHNHDEPHMWGIFSFRQRMFIQSFLEGFEMGGKRHSAPEGNPIHVFPNSLKTRIEELDAVDKEKGECAEKLLRMKKLVTDVRKFWDDHYLEFAKKCSEIRIREIERQRFKEAHRSVGRNDSCPCGSGKKFKKCCLQ